MTTTIWLLSHAGPAAAVAVVGVGTVLGPVEVAAPVMMAVVADELALDVEQAVEPRARRARAKMLGASPFAHRRRTGRSRSPSPAPDRRERVSYRPWLNSTDATVVHPSIAIGNTILLASRDERRIK
jgi:hypothetical protein